MQRQEKSSKNKQNKNKLLIENLSAVFNKTCLQEMSVKILVIYIYIYIYIYIFQQIKRIFFRKKKKESRQAKITIQIDTKICQENCRQKKS